MRFRSFVGLVLACPTAKLPKNMTHNQQYIQILQVYECRKLCKRRRKVKVADFMHCIKPVIIQFCKVKGYGENKIHVVRKINSPWWKINSPDGKNKIRVIRLNVVPNGKHLVHSKMHSKIGQCYGRYLCCHFTTSHYQSLFLT
jgi:hypothetical protein